MAIAKNPKVIMNDKEFVERLTVIKNRNTFYKNKYPFNLCYINSDGRTSADCVNLVKAILNGYDVKINKVGYFQRDLSNTGDCTEAELLAQCTDVSSDFKELGNKPLILYMKGHIGVYIGKTVQDKYNVIECTKSFGGGVVYSWVDSDGTRRKEIGGVKNGKWTHHGLPSKWVEIQKAAVPGRAFYYVKRGDTLSGIAKMNDMTLAELVSYNPQIKDINKIKIGEKVYLSSGVAEEYYIVQKGDTLGAIARKFNMALNKLLGLNPNIKNQNLIHPGDKIRVK